VRVAELVEAMLRQFDLSTDFGPCAGISRLQRCGFCARSPCKIARMLPSDTRRERIAILHTAAC
jgi:DNA polymerase delta, subunit 4